MKGPITVQGAVLWAQECQTGFGSEKYIFTLCFYSNRISSLHVKTQVPFLLDPHICSLPTKKAALKASECHQLHRISLLNNLNVNMNSA